MKPFVARSRQGRSTGRSSGPPAAGRRTGLAMAADGYRVGVLGATGAVGSTMLQVLGERGFPAAEVVPFASERSAGRKLALNGRELECRSLSEAAIQGLDLVLSSAGGEVSAEWAPRLVDAG